MKNRLHNRPPENMLTPGVYDQLVKVVGNEYVLSSRAALDCYGYDAYLSTHRPGVVIQPQTAQQVAEVVRILAAAGVAYVARGSGTGYAGGALPINGEAVIVLSGLRRIREINAAQRFAWVEAGVVHDHLQAAAGRLGLRYPPDPSSHAVCTIGGNVATNAGGPHCLGYGVTSNYVLELECVTADGFLVRFGGQTSLARGLDLRGLVVGSEGTMVIVTAVRVRLVPSPETALTIYGEFEIASDAANSICQVFRNGVQPIALDMTCGVIHPRGESFPFPNKSVLYVEVDGDPDTVHQKAERICEAIRTYGGEATTHSKGDLMQKRFQITQQRWRGITGGTNDLRYFLFDAVVRRTQLAAILNAIAGHARKFDFIVANTFHAGDGNIHPTPFFDPRDPSSLGRLEAFRDAVLRDVAKMGGALSGEHGLGIEKIHLVPLFFHPTTHRVMRSIINVFQPDGMLGRGKMLGPSVDASEYSGPNASVETHEIVSIDPENGYATVPADQTLAELQQMLEGTQYEFPYEPVDPVAPLTLGKLILSGAPSLRERKTGPARDLLLGGVLVNAVGIDIPFGSRFAKDVSALDLRKLVFGSGTRLGALRTVTLKLVPKEEVAWTAVSHVATMTDGQCLIRQLEQLRLPISAIMLAKVGGANSVRILLEASSEAVAKAKQRIADICTAEFHPWHPRMPFLPGLRGPLQWSEVGVAQLPKSFEAEDFVSFSYPTLTGRLMTCLSSDLTADETDFGREVKEVVNAAY